jgi:hypothetical protein
MHDEVVNPLLGVGLAGDRRHDDGLLWDDGHGSLSVDPVGAVVKDGRDG